MEHHQSISFQKLNLLKEYTYYLLSDKVSTSIYICRIVVDPQPVSGFNV